MNPFLIALIVVGSILIYVFTIYLADALLVKYDFERDATTRGLLAWFWPIYGCIAILFALCYFVLYVPLRYPFRGLRNLARKIVN